MAKIRKVRWYVDRLLSMSSAELGHRFQQRLTMMQDRISGLPELPSVTDVSWRSAFLKEEQSRFFFRANEQAIIQRRHRLTFREENDATMRTAESLLNHTFQLFGKVFELGADIPWQTDPLTHRRWPDKFYANIDTRDGETFGGVKWVWELNRHHHFVTIGKAYFLSGEERFADELCAQWVSWIEDNPPLRGVNWTSSLELAVRLINWTWALAFIRRSVSMSEVLFEQIMRSITAQVSYVSRHLSRHSSANNHLIGEAAGMATVGLCYPWLPHANQWRDIGLDILEQETVRQITPVGVPMEQATSYLAFVLDFNLFVWHLAELNGLHAPDNWYQRLGAASDFLSALMDRSGNVPAVGDGDDAWVVRLDDREEANNHASILASAVAILDRPDIKRVAQRWDEKSDWLLGESGHNTFNSLTAAARLPISRVFEEGGYGVLRSSRARIVFDCGPLGYRSTAAHGHADALSVLASVDGFPLLVDPGTYAYQEGGLWRDYFRSTSAHNTISVDGRNQSEMKGTFLWGQKARTHILDYDLNGAEEYIVAEHDGYATFGVTHRRLVVFRKPNWLLIGDRLLGEGTHKIEQFWHLHPAWSVQIGNRRISIVRQGHSLEMALLDLPQASIICHHGQIDPIKGWYSARYGEKVPAATVCIAAEVELPIQFATILNLDEKHVLGNDSTTIADIMRPLKRAWE